MPYPPSSLPVLQGIPLCLDNSSPHHTMSPSILLDDSALPINFDLLGNTWTRQTGQNGVYNGTVTVWSPGQTGFAIQNPELSLFYYGKPKLFFMLAFAERTQGPTSTSTVPWRTTWRQTTPLTVQPLDRYRSPRIYPMARSPPDLRLHLCPQN